MTLPAHHEEAAQMAGTRLDRLYYSAHALTTDAIGNLVPFAYFLAVLALLFPQLQQEGGLIERVYANADWPVAITAWAASVLLAFAATTILSLVVLRPAELLYLLLFAKKSRGRRVNEYEKHGGLIAALHRRVFRAEHFLPGNGPGAGGGGADVAPSRPVQALLAELTSYIEPYNQSGLARLYRGYARVMVMRNCAAYSLLAAVFAVLSGWSARVSDAMGPTSIERPVAAILLLLIAAAALWGAAAEYGPKVRAEVRVAIVGVRLAEDELGAHGRHGSRSSAPPEQST